MIYNWRGSCWLTGWMSLDVIARGSRRLVVRNVYMRAIGMRIWSVIRKQLAYLSCISVRIGYQIRFKNITERQFRWIMEGNSFLLWPHQTVMNAGKKKKNKLWTKLGRWQRIDCDLFPSDPLRVISKILSKFLNLYGIWIFKTGNFKTLSLTNARKSTHTALSLNGQWTYFIV